eukprot:TRINITY_DN873_c0_g1_i1.p1 TRINITY_DN873_c0_g1~~TRINITY_DN873_c0_g1_i1.p1  ORF type:complete len:179 (-),score=33.67 TRINITY_DN873_c0_g1_i1:124-660(-)
MGENEQEWKLSVNRYGPFGWVESFIKLVALGVGIGSISSFSNNALPHYPFRIGQYTVCAIALLINIILLVQRFFYKEVLAFFFSIFSIVSHAIIFIILFRNNSSPGSFIFTFSFLLFLAQLCSIFMLVFPKTAKFDPEQHPVLDTRWKIMIVSGLLTTCYFVFWVLQLVIWQNTFIEN